MSDRIGIALFGVGRWGTHLLRNFLHHPQAQVRAIVEPDADRRASLPQAFALDPDILLAADPEAALGLSGVDAVVIATPAVTHNELIQAALLKGHHVLAEKPLTLEEAEARSLCQLAEQQQRQLVVDHTYLFHPAVQAGRATLQAGSLGAIRYGYAARTHLGPVRQDVDALWDLAIHDIAILNHWLGESPVEVQAEGQVWLQPDRRDPTYFPTGLSDLVWVTLGYPSGLRAKIHLCWLNPDKQRRLCLVGDRGTLVFDELSPEHPLILQQGRFERQGDRFLPTDLHPQAIALPTVEPLRAVCDHFLDCVQHNRPSDISSGWVGADLVGVLNALTRSLNQGGHPVRVGG